MPHAMPRLLRPATILVGLIALLALSAWQWRAGAPIDANLLTLLPDASSDALQVQAQQRVTQALNREVLLLVSHPDPSRSADLSAALAADLRAREGIEHVHERLTTDLDGLRAQLKAQRIGLLDAQTRRTLAEAPAELVDARVAGLYEPAGGQALIPVAEDWFGLAERARQALAMPGHLSSDLDGRPLVERDGRRWYLLRLLLHGDAFSGAEAERVAAAVAAARQQAQAAGGELLAAGGALYAAQGQAQARHEMSLIGGLSLAAALLLLLVVFRTPRIWLLALPVAVGALAGSAACVALFGQVHVLTLVLGASLIGVSLDFPLHYLSKSWTLRPWHSGTALRLTLPGLKLALLSNLIGYLALAFTDFPGLTQVAVFSVAGLLGAFLCATGLLPRLFARPLQPAPLPLRLAQRLLDLRAALLARLAGPWWLVALLVYGVIGLTQVDFNDDLRQWAHRAPSLDGDARRIAELTGLQPTSQYFLVRADSPEALLGRQQALASRLDEAKREGALAGYLALTQLLASAEAQRQTLAALPALLEEAAPLEALGVPRAALAAEIETLRASGPVSPPDALAGPLGEPWRALWLDTGGAGVAALVTLRGVHDVGRLHALTAELADVRLIDPPGMLNRVFQQTQRQAALLKVLACAAILALLWPAFGVLGALRCLCIPLLAAFASLATLGWLGQPLTLFGLFGLLLVSAIGVDYAILMREAVGGAAVSLLGTLLAATTTWLSFGLLMLSTTPAVANFGLAVSLGLLFSCLLAPSAVPQDRSRHPARSRHGIA